jgi:hypothetical protein
VVLQACWKLSVRQRSYYTSLTEFWNLPLFGCMREIFLMIITNLTFSRADSEGGAIFSVQRSTFNDEELYAVV